MHPDKRSSPDEGSFSEAVRALADEKRRELGEHPAAEVLVAFSEKRLSVAEADSARDHLALCPDCRELLRDLGGFGAEPPTGSPELEGVDVEAAWQRMRSRLEGEDGESRGAAVVPLERAEPERRRGEGRWFMDRRQLAMAASLLLAVAGLGWGGYSWRALLNETKPKVNVPLINLFPEDDPTRGSNLAKVPAEVDDFVLVINPPALRSPTTAYRLEIVQDNRTIYDVPLTNSAGDGDVPDSAAGAGGILTLQLTRRQFPAGHYQIGLFDTQSDPQGEKVADYRFEVEGG